MFKKDKHRPENTPPSVPTGVFTSYIPQVRNHIPSPIPSNYGGANGEVATALPQSTTTASETLPSDTSGIFTGLYRHQNAATTPNSSSSSTLSASTRHPKPTVSFSTLHPSALQAAYEQGAQSAITAATQIEADKLEARNIIANYAVEPLEMLHLVDRWLQQLLDEFFQQRDQFKHTLYEKWENQELTNIIYDNNDRIRKIDAVYKELEKARDTLFSCEAFDELSSYLRKTDDGETDEMKEKVNILAEHYSKILQCLQFVDKETQTVGDDNSISDIKTNLLKLKELNNKQSHTICIVGLEKAGKSTFINALLGFELLPAAVERCTQIRTVLKPPLEGGNQQLFATVKFYDDQEFRVFFDKMTEKTDENQQQLQQRKEQVVQEREVLKAKFPEEHFHIHGQSGVERERTDIIKRLHDYITGELYVNIIKEITIYTDKLPGKNYELLDVPGFDSPIKEHRDAGLQAIKSADAFLFLTNGQQPSLTEPQIRLLNAIQKNHFEAMQRAFGIITKLDLCQTLAKYQEHYEKASTELKYKYFKPEHIYAACARIQILDENTEEFRVIASKLHSFGDDLEQGFERSKEGLNRFIEYELPKTHLRQLVDLGRTRLGRYVLERLAKIKEKELLPQNPSMMPIDEFIKQQNKANWDQVYYENIFQPVFAKANYWHAIIVTKERTKFIDDAKRKFHDLFLDLTKDFLKCTHQIEQLMFEAHGFTKLQLNAHPTDNSVREKLSIELEKIVDQTSDTLAKHFYHQYICELENILNDICPQLKDLYRTKLTLEKCTNETHALILRVCRPVIMATLRFSHLDLSVKQDAIRELIYIAPTVAFNIVNTFDRDGSGILGTAIPESVHVLAGGSQMTTSIIKTLFK
ncbi:unnamed protein product [Rotaria socialis]|uniref:Dynamin N-terminal domain-containing protein n=1 Tax=Rotaria socialis TaxID=392032 RepID=A0A818QEE2_9BILA|nr:unnamed protein product [Rotaria socialis]CAF4724798.1 unnamed protein product [Rotaria socialis]